MYVACLYTGSLKVGAAGGMHPFYLPPLMVLLQLPGMLLVILHNPADLGVAPDSGHIGEVHVGLDEQTG